MLWRRRRSDSQLYGLFLRLVHESIHSRPNHTLARSDAFVPRRVVLVTKPFALLHPGLEFFVNFHGFYVVPNQVLYF